MINKSLALRTSRHLAKLRRGLFDQTVTVGPRGAGCLAYHVVRASGCTLAEARKIEGDNFGIHRKARELLRLTAKQADALFGSGNWWPGEYGQRHLSTTTGESNQPRVRIAAAMMRALATGRLF